MIAAIVLAAGQSKRMGFPKLTMPWGSITVIGQVIATLLQAEISPIVVITGGARQEIEALLKDQPVKLVYNPEFDRGEMLSSVRVGLAALPEVVDAALITLGDQPQVELEVVRMLVAAYLARGGQIIVPSYHMHRGHPWLLPRGLWQAVMELKSPQTLRDLLTVHAHSIHYLPVETVTVTQDLDTPLDYDKYHP